MPLITESQYRDRYVPKTSKTISSEEILEAFAAAKALLIKYVGEAAVTDAELETPASAARGIAIRSAHIKLTKREMLETRASRFSDFGVMSASRDGNGNLTNSYEKYSEIKKERDDLLEEAIDILSPYLTATVVEETTIESGMSFHDLEIVY